MFKREQVKIERIVTHGNAFGIYFRDPEGNRAEVYWHTNVDWPQPFSRPINIEQPVDEVLEEGARILAATASPAATA